MFSGAKQQVFVRELIEKIELFCGELEEITFATKLFANNTANFVTDEEKISPMAVLEIENQLHSKKRAICSEKISTKELMEIERQIFEISNTIHSIKEEHLFPLVFNFINAEDDQLSVFNFSASITSKEVTPFLKLLEKAKIVFLKNYLNDCYLEISAIHALKEKFHHYADFQKVIDKVQFSDRMIINNYSGINNKVLDKVVSDFERETYDFMHLVSGVITNTKEKQAAIEQAVEDHVQLIKLQESLNNKNDVLTSILRKMTVEAKTKHPKLYSQLNAMFDSLLKELNDDQRNNQISPSSLIDQINLLIVRMANDENALAIIQDNIKHGGFKLEEFENKKPFSKKTNRYSQIIKDSDSLAKNPCEVSKEISSLRAVQPNKSDVNKAIGDLKAVAKIFSEKFTIVKEFAKGTKESLSSLIERMPNEMEETLQKALEAILYALSTNPQDKEKQEAATYLSNVLEKKKKALAQAIKKAECTKAELNKELGQKNYIDKTEKENAEREMLESSKKLTEAILTNKAMLEEIEKIDKNACDKAFVNVKNKLVSTQQVVLTSTGIDSREFSKLFSEQTSDIKEQLKDNKCIKQIVLKLREEAIESAIFQARIYHEKQFIDLLSVLFQEGENKTFWENVGEKKFAIFKSAPEWVKTLKSDLQNGMSALVEAAEKITLNEDEQSKSQQFCRSLQKGLIDYQTATGFFALIKLEQLIKLIQDFASNAHLTLAKSPPSSSLLSRIYAKPS